MGDVYVAPDPHRCDISSHFWQRDNNMAYRQYGSIWQCDECGRYWVKDSYWKQVQWWHFSARRRIRQAVRDA